MSQTSPDIVKRMAGALIDAEVTPMSPGTFLSTYVLPSQALSITAAARKIGLGRDVLIGLINHEISVDEDIAGKLGRLNDTPPDFWLDLQAVYEEARARLKPRRNPGPHLRR